MPERPLGLSAVGDRPARVLIVDAANVVGSVPDGWWRDRAGAAARLHASLVNDDAGSDGTAGFDRVVLVLEGRAREGVPPGTEGRVTTVHAPGSGDDELVAQCTAATRGGAQVTLATADRGLIARVQSHGVGIIGPRAVRGGS